jgi:FlaA1/EpsC-like NDP-sugar epimerase
MLGKHYYRRVKFIFQIGDLFFLNLAFIVASLITTSNLHFLPSEQTIIFLTMINVLWIVLALIIKLYRISRNIQLARKMFTAAIIISLHYLTVSFILKTSDTFDYDPIRIIYFYIFTYSLILTCKIILYKNLKFFRKLNHKSRSILFLRGSVSGNRNRIQHVV